MVGQRTVLLAIILLFTLGCARHPRKEYALSYELRAPAGVKLNPDTNFLVVSHTSASKTPASSTAQKAEGGFTVFSGGTLIEEADGPYAIIAYLRDKPSQVFVLPLAAKPDVTDWTDWRKPDYLESTTEKSDAVWTFMTGRDAPRLREIPPDSFQVRYRIDRWEMPRATSP